MLINDRFMYIYDTAKMDSGSGLAKYGIYVLYTVLDRVCTLWWHRIGPNREATVSPPCETLVNLNPLTPQERNYIVQDRLPSPKLGQHEPLSNHSDFKTCKTLS